MNEYVKIGRMRKRISIDQQVRTSTGANNETVATYTPVAYRWASVQPVATLQQDFQSMMQAQTTHLIRMRYYPGLTPKHRITLGTRHFFIVAPMNPDERNIEHQLQVKEVFTNAT